ncbi:MAG: helix-turn-helix domain-containing protein, partial [Pseudonocardiaceae bacterium]
MPWSSQHPTADHGPTRSQGPTALRIALGTQLRRLREASGISADAAGYAIRASHAKISRLELGRVGFKERDVADLLTLYGITDEPERRAFLALARRANVPGWWHQYSNILPSWFEMYLGLEQASAVIRIYQPQFVPDLLQTREVAREVIQLGHPDASSGDVERLAAVRMARQEILTQAGAPSLWVLIDEAALCRLDERSTRQAQIQHLITMTERPNVRIQVVPIRYGAQAAVGGPFVILRFSEPD